MGYGGAPACLRAVSLTGVSKIPPFRAGEKKEKQKGTSISAMMFVDCIPLFVVEV
jgi:hypothetical protein